MTHPNLSFYLNYLRLVSYRVPERCFIIVHLWVPLFQNESLVQNLPYDNEFDLQENEFVGGTHFHKNRWTRRLILTQGQIRQLGNGLHLLMWRKLVYFFRPLELPIPLLPESPQSLIASATGGVPSQWTSVPESEEFTRVALPTSSDQFKHAESRFRQSMSENKAVITSIERVQNPFMWGKYAR